MRALFLLILVGLLASCASRGNTLVRTSRQVEEDNRREAKLREHAEHEDRVLQAFTLQDVVACERLVMVRYVTLDKARSIAVDLNGNRILAQLNRAYGAQDFGLARTIGTGSSSSRDDYEVYRCDPPAVTGR